MTLLEERPMQTLKVGQILDAAKAEGTFVRERLVTYRDDMELYHAYTGALTLVLSREIRRSVVIACGIALHVAINYPDRKILFLNTYAGADLLTLGFVSALHKLQFKIRWTYQKFLPNATKSDFDDTTELPSPDNLTVIDCPTSTLTVEALEAEIAKHGAEIVILNSLDFAAFTDRRKKELAEALLALKLRLNLTLFVFSHEWRPIAPYSGGRGALGLLSAFATSVWHMLNEWEKKKWVNRFKSEELYEYETNKHTN